MQRVFCSYADFFRIGVGAHAVVGRVDAVGGALDRIHRYWRGKVGGKLGELVFTLRFLLPGDAGRGSEICGEVHFAVDADRLCRCAQGELCLCVDCYGQALGGVRTKFSRCGYGIVASLCRDVLGSRFVSQFCGAALYGLLPNDGCRRPLGDGLQVDHRTRTDSSVYWRYADVQRVFCGYTDFFRIDVGAYAGGVDAVGSVLGRIHGHWRGKPGGKLGELGFTFRFLLPGDAGRSSEICAEVHFAVGTDCSSRCTQGECGWFFYVNGKIACITFYTDVGNDFRFGTVDGFLFLANRYFRNGRGRKDGEIGIRFSLFRPDNVI